MNGQQLLSIVAVGSSGNRSKVGVRVARGESDIPSFAAFAGDGAVTLRWDAQAGEARYDVVYARDREVGDGTGAFVVESVRSPYVIRELTNGSRYVFRIRATAAGQPDAWSVEQEAVPLGPGTLKPAAVGEYGGVRLSWASVPGVKSCEVWRSAQHDDGWALIASGLAGTSWFDEQAAAGLTWFYRIRPAITGAIGSDPSAGGSPASSPIGRSSRQVRSCSRRSCGRSVRCVRVGVLRGRRHPGDRPRRPDSPREVASLPALGRPRDRRGRHRGLRRRRRAGCRPSRRLGSPGSPRDRGTLPPGSAIGGDVVGRRVRRVRHGRREDGRHLGPPLSRAARRRGIGRCPGALPVRGTAAGRRRRGRVESVRPRVPRGSACWSPSSRSPVRGGSRHAMPAPSS